MPNSDEFTRGYNAAIDELVVAYLVRQSFSRRLTVRQRRELFDRASAPSVPAPDDERGPGLRP